MILIVSILTACQSSNDKTFTGTIESIEQQQAIVHIVDGDIAKSSNKVAVDLSVSTQDITFQAGDYIKIGYDGEVRESEPLGINTIFIELISHELETVKSEFTGIIKEINGETALVTAKVFENQSKGDLFVDLSVNKNESFQVGDQIKVTFDGTVLESNPAQINTLFVERIEK